MVSKDVAIVANIFGAARRCLNHLVRLSPPEPPPEVVELLASLKMTQRQLGYLYTTFQELKQYDPLTLTTGPHEASTASMVHLVRNKRQWVEKILLLLLDLAGFADTVTWDGFLYVFIQFCTLSKVELCQVMFYIISKDMKSWTVHYLTSTQLEEFYGDYHDCEVPAFNTGPIDFSKLPLAKYHLPDFVELLFRFSPLINPCMHLQHSLQQALPNKRFWSDYDRIKFYNRKITIDFFRHKKVTSIFELLTGGKQLNIPMSIVTDQQVLALKDASRLPPDEHQIERSPPVEKTLPMPLGRSRPPRVASQMPQILPAWMEEQIKELESELQAHGPSAIRAAASGLDRAPAPPSLPDPRSVDAAKATIKATFGPPLPPEVGRSDFVLVRQPRPTAEREDAIYRSQELDFIRKSRRGEPRRDDFVSILQRSCTCELIDRPVKKVQGHA